MTMPSEALSVPHLLPLPRIGDAQKGFEVTAAPELLPFPVVRAYWTYFTPNNVLRGHHAQAAA